MKARPYDASGRPMKVSSLRTSPIPSDWDGGDGYGTTYRAVLTGWAMAQCGDEWVTPDQGLLVLATEQGPDQYDRPVPVVIFRTHAEIARLASEKRAAGDRLAEFHRRVEQERQAQQDWEAARDRQIAAGRKTLEKYFPAEVCALVPAHEFLCGSGEPSREAALRAIRDARRRQFYDACQAAGLGRWVVSRGADYESPDGMGIRQAEDSRRWEPDSFLIQEAERVLEADEASGFVGLLPVPTR